MRQRDQINEDDRMHGVEEINAERRMHGAAEKKVPDDRVKIKKRDWILALAILAAAGCLMLGMRLTHRQKGNTVEIRVDGALYSAYPLAQDQRYTIETAYGTNVIEVSDGAVFVTEADCVGHDCIRQGKISRCNETIVCLPHKLVVDITQRGGQQAQETEFDTVAK